MQRIQKVIRAVQLGGIALLLACALESPAQWRVGLTGGTNINRAQANSQYFSFYRVANSRGQQIGLRVEKDQPNKWSTWAWNITYIEKGDRIERTGQFSEYFVDVQRNYLQADAGMTAQVGRANWRLYGGASLYAAYWVSGTTTQADGSLGRVTAEELLAGLDETAFTFDILKRLVFPTEVVRVPYVFDQSFASDHRKDNRLDLGLTVRAGARYRIQRFTAFAEYSYSHGLRNLERFQDNFSIYQLPQHNRTHRFDLGLLYAL